MIAPPPLPLEPWRETRDALHRLAQVLGKLNLALAPRRNHWWHVALTVGPDGIATQPLPWGAGAVTVELDLLALLLRVRSSAGHDAEVAVQGRSLAAVTADLLERLDTLGLRPALRLVPYRLADPTPFGADHRRRVLDQDALLRWLAAMLFSRHVLEGCASGFSGKASPVHLFWHSLDLASSRFSGRRAPARPGADPVTAEAYAHEVASVGFWPGDDEVAFPAYYAYAWPQPAGMAGTPLAPPPAYWTAAGAGHEALLPYDAVRTAADPARALREFALSAFALAAAAGDWPAPGAARGPAVAR